MTGTVAGARQERPDTWPHADGSPPGRRGAVSRRAALLAGLGVLAAGSSAAAVWRFGRKRTDPAGDRAAEPATAEVTRTTLIDYKDVEGKVGYGEVATLKYTPPTRGDNGDQTRRGPTQPPSSPPHDHGQRLITWLPPVDSLVRRGAALFKVDNAPVTLLLGELPLYRDLVPGVAGPDVRQLKRNLVDLGYRPDTGDDSFTGNTAAAVKRWQRATGQPVTGTVLPGQAIYLPDAIRVREHKLKTGDAASGEVYTYTGTTRAVTAMLAEADARLATVGTSVTVTAPDGRPVGATVARVGAPIADPADAGAARRVEVMIAVTDQAALGSAATAPLRVRFVVAERRDVLTVPVVALLVRNGGGYAVRVVDTDGSTRVLPVETGMFAGGRVEVRTDGLRPGMRVEVPR